MNITGCFIIGFFNGITGPDSRFMLSPLARQFVMIGILGSFHHCYLPSAIQTAFTLAQDGQWLGAGANVLLSVMLCLIGVWLGATLAGTLNQLR